MRRFPALLPVLLGSFVSVAHAADPASWLVLGRAAPLSLERIGEIARSGEATRQNAIAHLQKHEAQQSLAGILEALEGWKKEGLAQDVEVLWVVNGVSFRAAPEIAERLRSRQDVEEVVADEKVQWAPPRRDAPRVVEGRKAWGIEKIGVEAVWQSTGKKGEGSVVGVIDTGADGNHPDLEGKIILFRDFTKWGTPVGQPYDDEGHGTHCSGSVAGGSASGEAIGVAPGAKLIVAKALDKSGAGGIVGLTRALQWMADPDGSSSTNDQPIAVSGSWGANLNLPVVSRVFWLAVSSLRNANIVPVFASGNEGEGVLSVPGSYPHSLAVGSTDSNDAISDFSSRGTVRWGFTDYQKPDVSAPGDFIYSCRTGGGYEYLSGTSMATPHIAGTVALLHSIKPLLSATQLEAAIFESSKDLGPGGRDATFGWGRLDVGAAAVRVKAMTAREALAEPAPGPVPELVRPITTR